MLLEGRLPGYISQHHVLLDGCCELATDYTVHQMKTTVGGVTLTPNRVHTDLHFLTIYSVKHCSLLCTHTHTWCMLHVTDMAVLLVQGAIFSHAQSTDMVVVGI